MLLRLFCFDYCYGYCYPDIVFLKHLLARQRWRCFDYYSLSGTFPAPSARLGVFESPDSSDRFAMDEEDEEDLEDDGEEARS